MRNNLDVCFILGCSADAGWTSTDTSWWVTKRVDAEPRPASTRPRWTARRQLLRVQQCSRRPWSRAMTRRVCRVLICLLEPCRTATTTTTLPYLRQHRDMSTTPSTGRTPMSPKQHTALNGAPTSGFFFLDSYSFIHSFINTHKAAVIIQELSYRQQIARQLRTQYAEGIYRHKYCTETLKSRLRVTQGHWKQNHWIDYTRLSSSRVIWRLILLLPWNVG